jgi:hypothetical protein
VAVLALHATLAGVAFRLLPHGFPLLHPRTILGTIVPLTMIVGSLVVGGLLLLVPRAGARCLPFIPAFWTSTALGLIVVFPETGSAVARPMGLVAVGLALLAGFTCRGQRLLALLPAVLVGGVFGQVTVHCERPAPAQTRPWLGTPPQRGPDRAEIASARVDLAADLVVDGSEARVTWRGRHATVSISPVLTFDRTSPDGFWSVFAPLAPRTPPATATTTQGELRLWNTDGAQRLHVRRGYGLPGEGTREIYLEAATVLARPVYSHLNSFTTVRVDGHRRLGLRFSHCPSVTIAVTHADYPSGAPARFAYVDATGFHVVEAADAEKGPFKTLAQGGVARDDTLEIDLVELGDSADPIARLEFRDFLGELSTALSPTAGYGVPENAIQFGLASSEPNSPAHLVLTLAASGIGRGWDSVAHAAGKYQNRVVLRSLEPAPAEDARVQLRDVSQACTAIARDISALRPKYPQLAAFDPESVIARDGECLINYAYRTHRSTRRGGWVAQVPNPDPDGVWFHVGIWDPRGLARNDQINMQAGYSVFTFGDDRITFLILEGEKARALRPALQRLLVKHGLGELVH